MRGDGSDNMLAMATALSLDRFAEIAAELESGRLVGEVLGRAGLSVEEWSEAQEVWLDAMGRELELGRFELSNRYSEVFLRRQQALVTPPAVTAPRVISVASTASEPIVREAKPTYLVAGAPSDTGPSAPATAGPPSLLAGTISVDVSAFGAALPFSAEAPPAPPPKAPQVKRPPAALSGTSMAVVLPKGPALPFAGAASPSAPPQPPPPAGSVEPRSEVSATPAVKRAPAALSGTSMAVVIPKGPLLPFAGGVAPGQSPPSDASGGETAPPAPPVKRAPAVLSGTSMAVVVPKGPMLPFGGVPAGSSAHTAARPSAEASPWAADVVGTFDGVLPRAEPAVPFDPGATPSLKPASAGESLAKLAGNPTGTIDKTTAPPAAPLPFAAPAEPPPLGFSIQQYASLCVEIATAPDQVEAALLRYRITAEQRKTLDAYWQGRIAADPTVWMSFDRAYTAYKDWFAPSRGK